MKAPAAIKLAALALLLATAAPDSPARRNVTTRRGPLVAVSADTIRGADETAAVMADTLRGDSAAAAVGVKGYQKPLLSRTETMFVTNRSGRTVSSVTLQLTYTDRRGQMLHRRTAELPLDIPPGETRQASLRSWDRQLTHYHESTPPGPRSRRQASPFRVDIKTVAVALEPEMTAPMQ